MAKGDILTAITTDVKDILTAGGFQNDIVFKANISAEGVTVKGITPVHHVQFDTDGRPVNSKQAHITVVEADLTDEGYTTRDANNEVNIVNNLVTFDSITYIITENYFDQTLGIITCQLGKYGS